MRLEGKLRLVPPHPPRASLPPLRWWLTAHPLSRADAGIHATPSSIPDPLCSHRCVSVLPNHYVRVERLQGARVSQRVVAPMPGARLNASAIKRSRAFGPSRAHVGGGGKRWGGGLGGEAGRYPTAV